jgi:hypothetical protein
VAETYGDGVGEGLFTASQEETFVIAIQVQQGFLMCGV